MLSWRIGYVSLANALRNFPEQSLFQLRWGGEKPRIQFSDRKDLQESAHLLFRGYSGFIRNELMHELVPSFTRQRVSQLLAMVDYLLDLLSTAKIPNRTVKS